MMPKILAGAMTLFLLMMGYLFVSSGAAPGVIKPEKPKMEYSVVTIEGQRFIATQDRHRNWHFAGPLREETDGVIEQRLGETQQHAGTPGATTDP